MVWVWHGGSPIRFPSWTGVPIGVASNGSEDECGNYNSDHIERLRIDACCDREMLIVG